MPAFETMMIDSKPAMANLPYLPIVPKNSNPSSDASTTLASAFGVRLGVTLLLRQQDFVSEAVRVKGSIPMYVNPRGIEWWERRPRQPTSIGVGFESAAMQHTDDHGNNNQQAFFLSVLLILSVISFILNFNHYRKLKQTFDSINKKYSHQDTGFYRTDSVVASEGRRKTIADVKHAQSHVLNISNRLTNIKEANNEFKILNGNPEATQRERQSEVKKRMQQFL